MTDDNGGAPIRPVNTLYVWIPADNNRTGEVLTGLRFYTPLGHQTYFFTHDALRLFSRQVAVEVLRAESRLSVTREMPGGPQMSGQTLIGPDGEILDGTSR
jgi:hypothetical protein